MKVHNLFLHRNFVVCLFLISGLFFLSFFVNFLFQVSIFLLFLFFVLCIVELFILFLDNAILASRVLPDKLSNGDDNRVEITIENNYPFKVFLNVFDDVPFQFQKRDVAYDLCICKRSHGSLDYNLRPVQRGDYTFGSINVFVSSPIRLVCRRYKFESPKTIASYPSIIQMKKYDIFANPNILHHFGIKKLRKVGHTMEFEHIREYIQGDDIRTINWKSTSKMNKLMVNQYQDEKSQNIYLVIDKGRLMQMPFYGMSLLDYSINTSLALSNIILKRQDKVGVISFYNKIENFVVSDRRHNQLSKILDCLYNIKTDFKESDFNRLYLDIRNRIKQRSFLILFTNFETKDDLDRRINELLSLSKSHLLLVVIFKNTELYHLSDSKSANTLEVYDKIISKSFIFEKKLIVKELRKKGINCLLTSASELTIDTINSYLEIKSRGLL